MLINVCLSVWVCPFLLPPLPPLPVLQATIQKRKRLMLHLKSHDPEAYKHVVIEKNLFKEAEQLARYKK
jgi:hypothetical protein